MKPKSNPPQSGKSHAGHALPMTTHEMTGGALPPIDVLDIPDELAVMAPQFQGMLKAMLDPDQSSAD
jgi:hypothetical protein